MAVILRNMAQYYDYLNTEIADPRTQSFFLIRSPVPGIVILGLYLMFVLKWGPEWMKGRKPFNLEKVLLVYNLLQIIFSAYLFVEGIRNAWGWKYRWFCEPVDFSNTEEALHVASIVHLYFLIKVLDLMDTVFFVLRKKNRQVSFLHVYHHTGMVMMTWGATKYLPGGHGTLIGVINSFVHVMMYGYYLLSIADPTYKQSLWWKKYITQLQIVQFLWLVIHFLPIVFIPGCGYPTWTVAVFLPQNLFMLILFADFYRKTYLQKPAQKITANGTQNGKIVVDTNSNIMTVGNGVHKKHEVQNGKQKKHD